MEIQLITGTLAQCVWGPKLDLQMELEKRIKLLHLSVSVSQFFHLQMVLEQYLYSMVV